MAVADNACIDSKINDKNFEVSTAVLGTIMWVLENNREISRH